MMTVSEERAPAERYHPRVEANFMVKLLVNGRVILVKASDLSMAGMLLVGDPALGREEVTVSVPLPNDREVVASCKIRRRSSGDVALEFIGLDWDDLLAFARYLHPRLP